MSERPIPSLDRHWKSPETEGAASAEQLAGFIEDDRLRRLFAYWCEKRAGRPMPSRADIDATEIPWALSQIFLVDYAPESGFRYRLAGTMEVETLGMDPTGHWLDDIHDAFRTRPDIASRYRAAVETGRATYRFGRVAFVHHREHRFVQNMILPFAADGVTVNLLMILSIMYHSDGVEVK